MRVLIKTYSWRARIWLRSCNGHTSCYEIRLREVGIRGPKRVVTTTAGFKQKVVVCLPCRYSRQEVDKVLPGWLGVAKTGMGAMEEQVWWMRRIEGEKTFCVVVRVGR